MTIGLRDIRSLYHESPITSISAIVLLASITLLLLRSLVNAVNTPLRDIPGPWAAKFTRLWLLRAFISRNFHKINLDLHRRYGPIVRISPNEYSIDDPDAAQILYRSHNQLIKSDRYHGWGIPSEEENIFSTTDNSHHAFRRRQTAKLYQRGTLGNFEPHLDRLTALFINQLSRIAASGEEVELNDWTHYYALDAIGAIACGRFFGLVEAGSDPEGLVQTTQAYSRYGAVVGVYHEFHPIIYRIMSMFIPKGGLGYLAKVLNDAIASARSPGRQEKTMAEDESSDLEQQPKDSVSIMHEMHVADPKALTLDDIAYHSLAFIGAGSDTTGAALAAVLYHLTKFPSVLRRLRQEFDQKESEGKLSHPAKFKEILECEYLQAVIKEVFRINPQIGLTLPRVIPEGGLVLAGRHFPAGTTVGINAWVANVNPQVFGADAQFFRPERWLDASREEVAKMDRYFMTFGKGPRTCLGIDIPQLEIGKLIPEIVTRFDFELVDGPLAEWRHMNDFFVMQSGFKVRILSREKK